MQQMSPEAMKQALQAVLLFGGEFSEEHRADAQPAEEDPY